VPFDEQKRGDTASELKANLGGGVVRLRSAVVGLSLPALVGTSTVVHWLAGRRLSGLWIMPDEAIYGLRALDVWRHGKLPLLHGEGAGYGVLYPTLAGVPLSVGELATGYASLKLLQALVMSLVAAPLYFYGRRFMRPAYALLGAALAVASPLLLYSGLLMTEVVIYPLGAFALLAIARAIETTRLRDQAYAFGAIAAALLTRVQGVVLVPIFASAILLDALLARDWRRARFFWPVWAALAAVALAVAAAPGTFGAYAETLRGDYPLGVASGLIVDHLAYVVLSVGIAPAAALVVLLVGAVRRPNEDRAAQAALVVTASALVLVVLQVGLFASRYAPHLLGRDLALLPPLLFMIFALWLDRGAPRPRLVATPVALAVFSLLALTPWTRVVDLTALPDSFDVVVLYRLGASHASAVVAGIAALTLLLFVALPRRVVLLLPALVLALLIVSSVVASNDITRRVAYDQRNLVGTPPDWIDRATRAPTAYLYGGEPYWNGVWQVRFWNETVEDVISIAPARVPGPLPQRVIDLGDDGRLPITEGFIVASDPHRFLGTPIAHLTQGGAGVSGLTLWRLEERARLSMNVWGVLPNGDMTEPGHLDVFDCAGGRLELTLLPKETRIVTIKLERRVVERAVIAGLQFWNGSVSVPRSSSPRVCHFTISGQDLLGSTRIEFVRP
jgi:hypothetical protein